MTIAVAWDVKQQNKQENNNQNFMQIRSLESAEGEDWP